RSAGRRHWLQQPGLGRRLSQSGVHLFEERGIRAGARSRRQDAQPRLQYGRRSRVCCAFGEILLPRTPFQELTRTGAYGAPVGKCSPRCLTEGVAALLRPFIKDLLYPHACEFFVPALAEISCNLVT